MTVTFGHSEASKDLPNTSFVDTILQVVTNRVEHHTGIINMSVVENLKEPHYSIQLGATRHEEQISTSLCSVHVNSACQTASYQSCIQNTDISVVTFNSRYLAILYTTHSHRYAQVQIRCNEKECARQALE